MARDYRNQADLQEAQQYNPEAATQSIQGLAKLLQAQAEPYIKSDLATKQREQDIKMLRDMTAKYPKMDVSIGDVSLRHKPNEFKLNLTPAQEAAEQVAGKKIGEFESGGRQAMESNISQIQGVQKDLEGKKRDMYDRLVGGSLEGHPTLQGLLAPSEKARRDQVQSAFIGMLHEAGIPRPTQWDIQRVFGQVYDPSAPDAVNIDRLKTSVGKLQAQKSQREQELANYKATGFATMGQQAPVSPDKSLQSPNPSPAPQPNTQGMNPPQTMQPPATRQAPMSFEEFKRRKAAGQL